MSRQSWRRGGAGRKLFRLPWAFGEGGVALALSLCDQWICSGGERQKRWTTPQHSTAQHSTRECPHLISPILILAAAGTEAIHAA